MNDPDGFPANAFRKADPTPDRLFYAQPRLVAHIDDAARDAVTDLYRQLLPPGGTVLDLMSSWISHLPEETEFERVVGLGMNDAELAANPRLDRRIVQDLNEHPLLDLPDDDFDAVCLCVSVQYLQQPVAVFREVLRVLRPGGCFVVTFSNRCFPTKAVAIWQALDGPGQQRLVGHCMRRAGFPTVEATDRVPEQGDPILAVIGRS